MAKVIAFRVIRCEEVCHAMSGCKVYNALKGKLDSQRGKGYVQFSMNAGDILPDTTDLRAVYRPEDPFRRTEIYCTKKVKPGRMMDEAGDICDFLVILSELTWENADFDSLYSEVKELLKSETNKLEEAGKERRARAAAETRRAEAEKSG